jgi:hypothetical protein
VALFLIALHVANMVGNGADHADDHGAKRLHWRYGHVASTPCPVADDRGIRRSSRQDPPACLGSTGGHDPLPLGFSCVTWTPDIRHSRSPFGRDCKEDLFLLEYPSFDFI